MIALDFAPGMHGHFLEYVLNRYIFGVNTTGSTIFQSSGSCHPINIDIDYQTHKLVDRGHYSSFDYNYPEKTKQVVFIQHNPDLDFLLLTNMYYRCHPESIMAEDFNKNEIIQLQISMMSDTGNTPAELKCNWYAKLMERRFEITSKKCSTDLPRFDFDYASFFELGRFLLEIKRTARFFNHTFLFDQSLSNLWSEFIDRNQGYHAYQLGQQLFTHIVKGEDRPVPDDWKIHAFLNYKLSTVFDLYNNPILFGLGVYPTSTKTIYRAIKSHIDNFDNIH